MKMLNDTFIIYNPEAGGGLARKKWQKFKEQLDSFSIKEEHQFTNYPGEAIDISASLVEKGYRRIAVFWGRWLLE